MDRDPSQHPAWESFSGAHQQSPQTQRPPRQPQQLSQQSSQQQGASPPPHEAVAAFLAAPPPALSPVSSRQSIPPATPSAASEAADEYFPAYRTTSVRSRASGRSATRVLTSGSSNVRPNIATYGGRQNSIRIRRNSLSQTPFPVDPVEPAAPTSYSQTGRPRSISQPERSAAGNVVGSRPPRRAQQQIALPRLTEEGVRPTLEELEVDATSPLTPSASMPEHDNIDGALDEEAQAPGEPGSPRRRILSRASRMFWPGGRRQSVQQDQDVPPLTRAEEFDEELVDWLDIVDPEVQTLSTLTNVQNSLFIPDLGNWLNRRPTYVLSHHDGDQKPFPALPDEKVPAAPAEDMMIPEEPEDVEGGESSLRRSNTITSRLTESHYAALPHGATLEGWTAEEKWELDDHVRHMLHSSRSKFKRRMKGFGQYVRRPLGFFVTLYATLITLFGLAWVLFLIGWIYVGEKQEYTIFIIDSILVALFALMGDGLAPFRAIDTYRLIFIWRYTRIIDNYKKGKRRSRLQKRNIPPDVRRSMEVAAAWAATSQRVGPPAQGTDDAAGEDRTIGRSGSQGIEGIDHQPDGADLEQAKTEDSLEWEGLSLSALTPKQQRRLAHHQKKLARSHSFYKPHETFTHHSFPLSYLIAIVILVDCHSCLQISLGACTWGIDYRTRPFALTTVILCVSITCNISAGIVIMMGDRKTRKKDVMELLNRQELTGDAIKHINKKKKEEDEVAGSSSERGSGPLAKIAEKLESKESRQPRESREAARADGVPPTQQT